MDICEKYWLDYLTAFGSLIAGSGSLVLGGGVLWVYWQQWKTQKKQFALSCEDKFKESYEKLNEIRYDIETSDKVTLRHKAEVNALIDHSKLYLTEDICQQLELFREHIGESIDCGALKNSRKDPDLTLENREKDLINKIVTWDTAKMYQKHFNHYM